MEQFDNGIIVDRPNLLSATRRVSEAGIMIGGWMLWIFLLRPLVLTVVWAFSVQLVYVQMIQLEGIKNLQLFAIHGSVILGIFLVFFAWNRYNFLRFSGKERRKYSSSAKAEELAAFFQMRSEEVTYISDCKTIQVSFLGNHSVRLVGEACQPILASYNPQEIDRQQTRKYFSK